MKVDFPTAAARAAAIEAVASPVARQLGVPVAVLVAMAQRQRAAMLAVVAAPTRRTRA